MKLDHLIEHNLGTMVKRIATVSILFWLVPTLGDLTKELKITRQNLVRATGA